MTSLERAGKALARARQAQADALKAAETEALNAINEGVTEVEIARTLGVNRMTVRRWAGKR